MRKIILAAMCATAIGVTPFAAFAQTTGPMGQDSTKMGTESTTGAGMAKPMKKSTKHKSMKKSSMMKEDKKM
jgi:hypothetical protein